MEYGMNKILQEIENELFKNFKVLDKEAKVGFATGSVVCWGFNKEEKAKKFIEQTHVIRGRAIQKFLKVLNHDLENNINYYFNTEKLLERNVDINSVNVKNKESVITLENLSEHKDNLLKYFKLNWALFPIGFLLYENGENIALQMVTPKFINEFNKLNIVEKIFNLNNLVKKSEDEYVSVGSLSDKILDVLVFNRMNNEIDNLEGNFDVILDYIKSLRYPINISDLKEAEDVFSKTNFNDSRRKFQKDFTLKISSMSNSENILTIIDFMLNTYDGIHVISDNVPQFVKYIKEGIKLLDKPERERVIELYKTKSFFKYTKDGAVMGSLSVKRFMESLSIEIQLNKDEAKFDDFIDEKNEVIYRKTLKTSKSFLKTCFKVSYEYFKHDKITFNNREDMVEIVFLTDFKLNIKNEDLFNLLANCIRQTISEQSGEDLFFTSYDFNKNVDKMLHTISLSEKLENSNKEELETKLKKKI